MTDQHPITPPLELLQQWATEYWGNSGESIGQGKKYIATQAARWGADRELDECVKWMKVHIHSGSYLSKQLRAARRPKPPSLAEEALEALEQIDGWAVSNMNHLSIHDDLVTGVEAIRTALERLKELENIND